MYNFFFKGFRHFPTLLALAQIPVIVVFAIAGGGVALSNVGVLVACVANLIMYNVYEYTFEGERPID